jgi:hypothetical protein
MWKANQNYFSGKLENYKTTISNSPEKSKKKDINKYI